MSPGSGKNDTIITEKIYHDPVIFDMTFGKPAIIAGKLMLPAVFRQGFFPNYLYKNIKKIIRIIMSFFRQLEVFFELIGKSESKHRLNVQFFPRFLNGIMPFSRYLSAGYIPGLLHCCQSNGIKTQFPGFAVAVFCAKRAVTLILRNGHLKSIA